MPLSLTPTVLLQKGHSSRLRHGHPWVFSNELQMTPDAKALAAGSLVRVVDAGGEVLAVGTFNPHSLIAVRVLARPNDFAALKDGLNVAFFVQKLRAALTLRDALFPTPHYRLVHSEADQLPGLIVDRYGDVLSVQLNTAGMEALWPMVHQALQELLAPRSIVLRNDSPVRGLEGLPLEHHVIGEAITAPLEILENGCTVYADLSSGQKTGWFYDQRPNRAFMASLARGRTVLDVFCYGGGFGLQALHHGASRADFIDRSADALALVTQAAAANGVSDRTYTHCGDAFRLLEEMGKEGRRFGVVIADPPAFAKSRKDIPTAAKGYRKMARMAAALVEDGGFLLCGSCSHHMAEDRFFEEVTRGIAQAGRHGSILWRHGAGPDHPVHPSLPESAYLKVVALRLD